MVDLALTRAGKRQVNGLSMNGLGGQIMGILGEHGSLSVSEIAEFSGASRGAVKSASRKLHRKQLIRIEGQSDDD